MTPSHSYYVYIIQCSDGLYYTGVTNDVNRRIDEHDQGLNKDCFTYKRRPVVLKYVEPFTHILQAIEREKQIKGWSRAKKEALMKGDYEGLKELAKTTGRRTGPSTGSG